MGKARLTPLEALEVGFQLGLDVANGVIRDGREAVRWTSRHDLPRAVQEGLAEGGREHAIHFAKNRDLAIVALKRMLRELCGEDGPVADNKEE